MRQSASEHLHERPGGARRADTFLLVVATILEVGVGFGFRSWHPPVIPFFVTAVWLHVAARWMGHVRPQFVRSLEYLGAVALGAALYAGWAAR